MPNPWRGDLVRPGDGRVDPEERATSDTIASVVAESRTGHSSLPMRATAAASFVTALSRMTCEPCAAVPRATSLIHMRAFSPVCSR